MKRDLELEVTIVEKYVAVTPVLDERSRRRWAAAESMAIGYGGDALVSSATALARETIRKGRRGIARGAAPTAASEPRALDAPASSRPNGGTMAALEALVDPLTRGDPTSPLGWTCKSRARLTGALTAAGWRVSGKGATHPDRNAQFEHINQTADEYLTSGQPVIAVDTKKKELVGNFANRAGNGSQKGIPPGVRVHDFATDAEGKAIPYGV